MNFDRTEGRNKQQYGKVGSLNTSLSIMDRTTRQISKKRGLKQYYRPTGPKRHIELFIQKQHIYIFFGGANGTLLMIDCLVGHKTNLKIQKH